MKRDTNMAIEVVHEDTMKQIKGLDPTNSHGWIVPRPDGKRTCAGPEVCRECQLERALFTAADKTVVVEGFKIQPGDQILLIAPVNADRQEMVDVGRMLKKQHPDVVFTIVAGFTGVQIASS